MVVKKVVFLSMALGFFNIVDGMLDICFVRNNDYLADYVASDWSYLIKKHHCLGSSLRKALRVWDMSCEHGKKTYLIVQFGKKNIVVGTTSDGIKLGQAQQEYHGISQLSFSPSVGSEQKFDFILATNEQNIYWTPEKLKSVVSHLDVGGKIVVTALHHPLQQHDMVDAFRSVGSSDEFRSFFENIDPGSQWYSSHLNDIEKMFKDEGLSIISMDCDPINSSKEYFFSFKKDFKQHLYKTVDDFGLVNKLDSKNKKKFLDSVMEIYFKNKASQHSYIFISYSIPKVIIYAEKRA